jgi:hypothetical protein
MRCDFSNNRELMGCHQALQQRCIIAPIQDQGEMM